MVETIRYPLPIIVGAPRSGTALLRIILDAHPDIALPHEAGFFTPLLKEVEEDPDGKCSNAWWMVGHLLLCPAWEDFQLDAMDLYRSLRGDASIANITRKLGDAYAARFSKPRCGFRDNGVVDYMPLLKQMLPEIHFVHVVRDGRAVVSSLRNHWSRSSNDIEVLSMEWARLVTSTRKIGSSLPNYIEVKFEELVLDPESCMKSLCTSLELPFEPAMLEYHRNAGARMEEIYDHHSEDRLITREQIIQTHETLTHPLMADRANRWRIDLSIVEQKQVNMVAGKALEQFGYH